MATTNETNSADRHALLTTKKSQDLEHKKSVCTKQTKITVVSITIAITIIIIIILLVLDVFDLFVDKSSITPGMIGLWPTYGGNLQNQQISPSNVILNKQNIQHISIKCIYESDGGLAFSGYPTIDNDNNSYFSDASGYITCINLDSCQPCWRQNVAELLGFNNMTIVSHQTLTIFRDSNGNEGLLLGAPSKRTLGFTNYPSDLGCFALAVHKNNGSFWWRVQIGNDYVDQDYSCSSFGFYVDGKYAFGGFTQSCCYDYGNNDNKKSFIGRFLKIDIDLHQIVDIWYPFNYNLTQKNNWDKYNSSYQGCSIYNYPAILDNYVAFGTANLWRIPYKIQQCLVTNNYDDYLSLNESLSIDICGNDKADNKYYRCLPKDNVYPSSLIILNKNDFKLHHAHILSGVDVHMGDYQCLYDPKSNKLCPGYYDNPLNKTIVPFNSDLTAVAMYTNKISNKKYVIASQKPSRLHVFELETGILHFTKKFGPQSLTAEFSMAVDENSMIGVTSILGVRMYGGHPRYKLSNNLTVCNGTGTVVAFDLNTGNTLWQMVNPYGAINESMCFNDTLFNKTIDYIEQEEITCDSSDHFEDSSNVFVHIPDILNQTLQPINIEQRAFFRSPATIVNNMVFIASESGDVYVRDLFNGSFIHQFMCPKQPHVNGTYNRAAISSGISIVNDRIVFYCGGYFIALNALNGNQLISMKL